MIECSTLRELPVGKLLGEGHLDRDILSGHISTRT